MASWANLITIGTQPGPGILDAIRMVQAETNTSISALIVAEMSSKGLQTFCTFKELLGSYYWLNYWHTCAKQSTSSFTSNTLLIPKQDQFMV